MNFMNGCRYFIIFIDYFSRVIWVYLMNNKSEMCDCFKKMYRSIQTQYWTLVKMLRSDNGIKYTNRTFGEYLLTKGIHHQTTCPYTLTQNREAERKKQASSSKGS
jgi:Integrase core domain